MAFSDALKTITPAISEIKTGTPGIKIGDKYIVGGIGGNFIPAGPGGSSMDFYKCASVDTTNHKWSGYRATLVDGKYVYDSTVTSGLVYTVVVPTVGSVYTADCLAEVSLYVGIPTTGLVYHHRCDALSVSDECGHVLTYNQGDIAIEEDSSLGKDGNKIMNLQAGTVVADLGSSTPSNWTISAWLKESNASRPDYNICFVAGHSNYYRCRMAAFSSIISYSTYGEILSGATITNWNHYAYVKDGTTLSLYLNGVLVGNSTPILPSGARYLCLGSNDIEATYADGTAKYGNVRMYNRALDASEIFALANEFTPTVS